MALVNEAVDRIDNRLATSVMLTTKHQQIQPLKQLADIVKRALLGQVGLILLSAGIAMMIDSTVAVAIVVGGIVSLLPNVYFAGRVLLLPAPLDVYKRLRQLYMAEAIKLMISALLFALVFSRLKQVPPVWVLVGFLLAHVGYLTVLMRLRSRRTDTVTQEITHER